MLCVTPPVHHVISPAQKTEQSQKKCVQKSRLEDRPMGKFMGRIQQEGIKRSVNKKKCWQRPPKPVPGRIPDNTPGQQQQTQMTTGLQQPFPVTPPIQLAHGLARQRRPDPADRLIISQHGCFFLHGAAQASPPKHGSTLDPILHGIPPAPVHHAQGRAQFHRQVLSVDFDRRPITPDRVSRFPAVFQRLAKLARRCYLDS